MSTDDARYLKTVLDPIRVCALYKPKFGQGLAGGGLTLEQFRKLYQSDAFYNWFGLDNPLMYAAHKASDGEFQIDGLQAHTIWEYLEDRLNFLVNSGSIGGGRYDQCVSTDWYRLRKAISYGHKGLAWPICNRCHLVLRNSASERKESNAFPRCSRAS